jgi:hypothetical protein
MNLTDEDLVHLAKADNYSFLAFRDNGFEAGQDAAVAALMDKVHKRVIAETQP